MSESIKRLKEITPFLNGIVERRASGIVEYDVERGTSIGFGLFKDKHVAVQRNFCSSGTVFPAHQHHENEVIILYTGRGRLLINGDPNNWESPAVFWLKPNQTHLFEFYEDTHMIAVTVPASKGYPDGLRK